jgi:hypothetical protein
MDLNELKNNPEQIKGLIALLQNLIQDVEPNQNKEVEESQKNTKQKRVGGSPDRPSRHNAFLDMPEKDMHKEDRAVDKILNKHPPVARCRDFEPVKVTCRVCGRSDMVNPSLVYDSRENRYKCNRCSTTSG